MTTTSEAAEKDFRIAAAMTFICFAVFMLARFRGAVDGEIFWGFLTAACWYLGYRCLKTRDRLEREGK